MFTFQISERTLRYLLRDPQFIRIANPDYSHIRDALLRLQAAQDAVEACDNSKP